MNDMRLIESDKVIPLMRLLLLFNPNADKICKDMQEVVDIHTIDAVPVKRGTWKLNKDGSGTCDQCHFTQKAVWDFDRWQNFCGVCGADMRERKGGDA